MNFKTGDIVYVAAPRLWDWGQVVEFVVQADVAAVIRNGEGGTAIPVAPLEGGEVIMVDAQFVFFTAEPARQAVDLMIRLEHLRNGSHLERWMLDSFPNSGFVPTLGYPRRVEP
jgi:hypothetical protein